MSRRTQVLSPREEQILTLVESGKRNKAIAELCGIALGTVKVHVANIRLKLGADVNTKTTHLRPATERTASTAALPENLNDIDRTDQ